MHMLNDRWLIMFFSGIVVGAGLFYLGQQLSLREMTADELIAEYYKIENEVHVSPHGLRGKMDRGDQSFVLVDLRSSEEYQEEHISGAVNVPAYSDRYTSAYGEVERIVGSFEELVEQNPEKDLIVYCYSQPCMTGRKIGGILAEHGIYVKHLNIGWYEWRHAWASWNHEHEWDTDKVEDYITLGPEPGQVKQSDTINPCVEGEFGC